MKYLYFIFTFTFSLNLFSQEHGHCEHHCQLEKEIALPHIQYQNSYSKRNFSSQGLQHFIGSTHQHSGFSDGYPNTTPSDYFQSGINQGFDFVFGADHSDSYLLPITLHGDCASEQLIDCIAINPLDPVNSVVKWPVFEDIVEEFSSDSFAAVRGFEWTSDRFGHINVYFSKHISNAKTDGGYVLLETFWNWFTAEPVDIMGLEGILGGYGAADGVGVFNHPGDKSLYDEDEGFNWNQFEYIPQADSQMVGIEVFNDGRDYAHGSRAYYQQALDAGWHVGAIASEDHHDTNWNNPEDEKTVIVAQSLSHQDLKEAMLQRRTYAVRDFNLRLDYYAGEAFMGSKIERKTDSQVLLSAKVSSSHDFFIELVSNNNEILAVSRDSVLNFPYIVEEAERWFYLRVANATDSSSLAYSSPIWIKGGGEKVDPVGIADYAQNLRNEFYPNPSTGLFYLQIEPRVKDNCQVHVFNSLGQELSEGISYRITNGQLQLDLSTVARGAYCVMVEHKEESSVYRVVKGE